MDNWSVKDVIDKIKDSDLSDKVKTIAIKEIENDKIAGKNLININSVEDVKKNFNFGKPVRAEQFFDWLKKNKKLKNKKNFFNFNWSWNKKNKTKNEKIQDAFDNLPSDNEEDNESEADWDEDCDNDDNKNNTDENNNYTFYISWSYQTKKFVSNDKYNLNSKLSEAIYELQEIESWGVNSKSGFIVDTKSIGYDKIEQTFKSLGINAPLRGTLDITIVAKMIGGSKIINIIKKKKKTKKRQFTKLMFKKYSFLKKMMTFDEDIISLDDSEELRAKMPCGHVISPESMYKYVDSSIRENCKITKIFCPVPECKKEWKFELCSVIACMTDKEYSKYKNMIKKRLNPELKKCPSCKVLVQRPKDLKMLRVNCGQGCCDFCFSCLKTWKKDGYIVCSNDDCSTANINKVLATCKKIVIREKDGTNYGNYNKDKLPTIPIYRSCVYCTQLIEYDYACKHMTCQACGGKFCFSCLRTYNNGWKCGSHYAACPGGIAPVQVLN